jgi:hypothetical protein
MSLDRMLKKKSKKVEEHHKEDGVVVLVWKTSRVKIDRLWAVTAKFLLFCQNKGDKEKGEGEKRLELMDLRKATLCGNVRKKRL